MDTNLLGDERYLHYPKLTLVLALYNQESPWPQPPHLSSNFFSILVEYFRMFFCFPLGGHLGII
jgi:hypothetical protein